MMRRTLLGAASGVLFGMLLLAGPAWAENGGPQLAVRAATGATTLRLGERIPLLLSFTAGDEQRYVATMQTEEREGRCA